MDETATNGTYNQEFMPWLRPISVVFYSKDPEFKPIKIKAMMSQYDLMYVNIDDSYNTFGRDSYTSNDKEHYYICVDKFHEWDNNFKQKLINKLQNGANNV